MMYLPDVPASGEPVDPMASLALRFRIGYTAYPVQAGTKDLGRLEETHTGHLLFWGHKEQDPVSIE